MKSPEIRGRMSEREKEFEVRLDRVRALLNHAKDKLGYSDYIELWTAVDDALVWFRNPPSPKAEKEPREGADSFARVRLAEILDLVERRKQTACTTQAELLEIDVRYLLRELETKAPRSGASVADGIGKGPSIQETQRLDAISDDVRLLKEWRRWELNIDAVRDDVTWLLAMIEGLTGETFGTVRNDPASLNNTASDLMMKCPTCKGKSLDCEDCDGNGEVLADTNGSGSTK